MEIVYGVLGSQVDDIIACGNDEFLALMEEPGRRIEVKRKIFERFEFTGIADEKKLWVSCSSVCLRIGTKRTNVSCNLRRVPHSPTSAVPDFINKTRSLCTSKHGLSSDR